MATIRWDSCRHHRLCTKLMGQVVELAQSWPEHLIEVGRRDLQGPPQDLLGALVGAGAGYFGGTEAAKAWSNSSGSKAIASKSSSPDSILEKSRTVLINSSRLLDSLSMVSMMLR